MQDLTITLVQTELAWRSASENLKRFGELLKTVVGKPDLVVLPEMFTTGFTMQPEQVAEQMNGPTLEWVRRQAERMNAAITGSVVIAEDGKYFNRLVFVTPDGQIMHYDKKHLFSIAGETKPYHPGNKRVVISYKGWNILPLVCYDLRFPVWSRNRILHGQFEYDLVVLVANWPQARNIAWKTLLLARAIENQSYVVGVNRIGTDDNGVIYSGDSLAADCWGAVLCSFDAHQEAVRTITLSKQSLIDSRRKFAVSNDWDQFEIQ